MKINFEQLEEELAAMEAEASKSAKAYFNNRPKYDSDDERTIFVDGFQRGFDSGSPHHPLGISEHRIQQIIDAMPDGLSGYLKSWGWLQFARAIEKEQGIPRQHDLAREDL